MDTGQLQLPTAKTGLLLTSSAAAGTAESAAAEHPPGQPVGQTERAYGAMQKCIFWDSFHVDKVQAAGGLLRANNLLQPSRPNPQLFLNVLALWSKSSLKHCSSLFLCPFPDPQG